MHLKEDVVCVANSVERGHIGTLAHSSFRWKGTRIFNALPPTIRNYSNCDVLVFKCRLDNYLAILPDIPCTPNMDNSITGPLGSDHLPILIRLQTTVSVTPASHRTYVNLKMANWARFTQEINDKLSKRPLPSDCQKDEKTLRAIILSACCVGKFV